MRGKTVPDMITRFFSLRDLGHAAIKDQTAKAPDLCSGADPATRGQGDGTRRREFIRLLGGAAVAWPLTTSAQQAERVRRIGVLMDGTATDMTLQAYVAALRTGLQKLGWTAGQNLRIQDRWAESDSGRMRTYATELVTLGADVILTGNTPIVQELQRQTRTIPIVFVALGDPVATGVVASLARPGGNATGFMNPPPSVSGKWLELLKEIAPSIKCQSPAHD